MRISVNLVAAPIVSNKNGIVYAKVRLAHNDRETGTTTFMNGYFSGEDAVQVQKFTTRDLFSCWSAKKSFEEMDSEYTNQETGEVKHYNDMGRGSHIRMISSGASRDAKVNGGVVV